MQAIDLSFANHQANIQGSCLALLVHVNQDSKTVDQISKDGAILVVEIMSMMDTHHAERPFHIRWYVEEKFECIKSHLSEEEILSAQANGSAFNWIKMTQHVLEKLGQLNQDS